MPALLSGELRENCSWNIADRLGCQVYIDIGETDQKWTYTDLMEKVSDLCWKTYTFVSHSVLSSLGRRIRSIKSCLKLSILATETSDIGPKPDKKFHCHTVDQLDMWAHTHTHARTHTCTHTHTHTHNTHTRTHTHTHTHTHTLDMAFNPLRTSRWSLDSVAVSTQSHSFSTWQQQQLHQYRTSNIQKYYYWWRVIILWLSDVTRN